MDTRLVTFNKIPEFTNYFINILQIYLNSTNYIHDRKQYSMTMQLTQVIQLHDAHKTLIQLSEKAYNLTIN